MAPCRRRRAQQTQRLRTVPLPANFVVVAMVGLRHLPQARGVSLVSSHLPVLDGLHFVLCDADAFVEMTRVRGLAERVALVGCAAAELRRLDGTAGRAPSREAT